MSEEKRLKWFEVKAGDKIFNFEDTNVLDLGFLDNGLDVYDKEITKKDGTKDIISHTVEFKVINLKNEEVGMFSASAKNLMENLSEISNNKPDKMKISIRKIEGKTIYDNTYHCSLIEDKTKK